MSVYFRGWDSVNDTADGRTVVYLGREGEARVGSHWRLRFLSGTAPTVVDGSVILDRPGQAVRIEPRFGSHNGVIISRKKASV